MDLVGRAIGQYQIVERIGQGGMAAVFKAYQPALDRHVAIKVLPAQHALTPGFSERFEREARAIAQLNHPNILPIIDYGQVDDLSYIVMKHVPGGTLAERLRRPIDLPAVVRIVEQIASALDHAHSRGIIHRDVKPSNVLLDEGEWALLADFGLAKLIAGDQNLTGTGTGMGTPAYLSPEQGQGLPLDHHTDIYSLGVILYEMLAGRLPYTSETPMGLVIKHIYEAPPRPRMINPAVPEAVESVILGAMAKPIAERYTSAGDMARALRQAVALSPSIADVGATRAVDPYATPILGILEEPVQVATLPHRLLMMETVPAVPQFVGRSVELAAYGEKLRRDRFVVMTGMAGVGKTTLGAKLAREAVERAEHIFWFTFDHVEKSTADALFWALAAFLEGHGEPNLWRYLQGEIGAQKPLERTVKVNLLLSGLASGDYVLCFDDFQVVNTAPDVAYVFKLIQQRFVDLRQAAPMPARIIIMGREVPLEMEYLVSSSLGGFTHVEAEMFVGARKLHLPAPLLRRLWERTEGNAKLLELSASALAALGDDAPAMEGFVDAMARRGDVRDYLMTNIYAALKPEERLVAGILSIFPVSVEREVAEEALAAEGITGVAPRIDALLNKRILSETGDDRLHCHSLVREYGYHVLDRKERERYHQSAAEVYERQRNHLAAAHHHFERRAYGPALDALTGHAQAIINAGGAGALLEQLGRFQRHVLSLEQRVALSKTQADAHRLRGEYSQALGACEVALQEATDEADRAELFSQVGTTHRDMGEYDRALEYYQQSLAIGEAISDQARVAAIHDEIGWAHFRLGYLAPAREHFAISQQIGQQLSSKLLLSKIDLRLGLIEMKEGKREQARERFERSLRVFRSAGDRRREAMAVGNLALIYYEMNDAPKTLACYREAVAIQEEIGDVESLRISYSNLGYFYYELGDHEQAIQYYERLMQLAQVTEHQRWLSMAHSGLADAHLGLGHPQQALEHAQEALRVAQAVGPGRELGISCAVLGQVWLALGNTLQAKACFEQGIPLLEEFKEHGDLDKARQGYERASAQLRADSKEEDSTHA